MPYKDIDDGHRIGLTEDVMPHSKQVFEQGLQLEAILLAHEYLEQRLNAFFMQVAPSEPQTIHRKFKQLIDLLRSEEVLAEEDYEVLNEFNRLRNVNSNQILNFSLTLRGAKKGDMIKAMDLAEESERVISRLSQEFEESRKSRKGKKKR
jgi:S-adenosylmethionine:tRNA-ribosyltransferase-isomerase (queuine synthetase)